MDRTAFRPKLICVVLGIWLGVALLCGGLGWVAALRPPMPQAVLLGLVALLCMIYRKHRGFRDWILSIPADRLVAVHITRFVGIYFLWLYAHRGLPFAFAVPGGCGDIAVASLAAMLLLLRSNKPPLYWIWNTLGLMDILFVITTAARLGFSDPRPIAPLLRLPLSLLPTFLVPIIIFTHLILFVRLHRRIPLRNPQP